MDVRGKATRITLTDLKTPQMRAFHLTWFAFFLCFFGWFGIAPLMAVVREDLMLTKLQIGNTVIASVAITVLIRLLIGPLCDRYGARLTYSGLLLLTSLPVMGIGLAHSYTTFLLFRLAIGAIGASFVITQYHTSIMFAPNCVGTANATTAGWGNLGGGVTQIVMPLIFAAGVSLGVHPFVGWRLAMVVPGVALFATAFAYSAGLIAGLFGLMNIFARTLGGVVSDRCAVLAGLKGRVWCLGIVLFLEGIALMVFSRMPTLGVAVVSMIIFSLFVQMSEGATFGLVPFINNKKAIGPVAGIVGAGGNAGAVAAGFLLRIETLSTQNGLLILGLLVAMAASLAFLVRFSPEIEAEEKQALVQALAQRQGNLVPAS